MVEINDKVWFTKTKETGVVTGIEERWTSYPHGSGTYYDEYKIKMQNGTEIICDDWNGKPFISVKDLENKNKCLKDKIQDIYGEINKNNELIETIKNC